MSSTADANSFAVCPIIAIMLQPSNNELTDCSLWI